MKAETYEELIEWFCNMPESFRRQNQIRAGVAELKVGPNDLCPCGSGKKFKKCCRR